jgi:cell fate regulator YaaT (PSP1 superfamily)
MPCKTCSSKTNGSPKGCKNNGTCGTDSCNKLTVFNWLSNMNLPSGQTEFNFCEVRFKNGRKDYFLNKNSISLSIGDIVSTQADHGFDVGIITLTGELVRVQMNKKKVNLELDSSKIIYRKSIQNEIDNWSNFRDKEESIKVKARQLAIDLRLKMKISDIEYQGDGTKITFYYTAEERVDFRELIKLYARDFRTKIEMKQVGLRQEASRLGGIGSCGRELCCSTWLTDFRSVSTSAARYQQLSLNPQKLAGQCGKLKCCLNYELGSYMDALKNFPKKDIKLKTQKGIAVCQKTDIFKKQLWYAYEGEWSNWFMLSADQVNLIISKNKSNKLVSGLEEYLHYNNEDDKNKFENVVGQDSLTRFDRPRTKKNKSRKRKKNVS